MSPDLRVALSLWLNAYDAACKAEQDLKEDRFDLGDHFPKAVAEFEKASEALYAVADIEVEEPPTEPAQAATPTEAESNLERWGFAVPRKDRLVELLVIAAKWDAANKIVDRLEEPSYQHYAVVDRYETEFRRFLATCKRMANLRQGKHDEVQEQREA